MIRKLCVLFLFLALPGLVQANWNDAWTSRAKVSVNTQGFSATVTQPTIAVRLHSGNFSFTEAKLDGSDLRFIAADDKTELKFHIEKYDAVNELAVIWVQLPKIDPADKAAHFWVYYGNDKATPVADSKAGWDASTLAVFNFAQKSLLQDSSVNAISATGEVTVDKAALLGEAAIFNGKPLTLADSPLLKLTAASTFTFSAWIKPATLPQDATLFQQGALAIKIEGQKLVLTADSKISSDADLKPTGWQYVTATIDNGKVALYVDGKNAANGNITLVDELQPIQLGANYNGEMDQVELANVARTADWIKLAADGQGPDSQLLKIEEESAEGDEEGGTSYFGVLFNSLTTDAWVVIIILAIMFVISAAVMVTKAMLITRTAKGNDVFIDRFRNANDDLLELEPQAITAESSIYRLYGAGLREIRKRYKDEKVSLSGAALNAIKASIDAELIRETHTLNAKMVLLTIAISGGPFLGLLGTVVGVMITFAAIAAAGDVNVNAIAPGIAAALLATVAGLAVAIPALFGYNYLGSRIKTITSDMQIFVDEFITRVAELHGQ